MNQDVNVIFTGEFSFPNGMAGTKRIKHAIKALRRYPNVKARVILQRQSSQKNILSGKCEGTPYETVMGDLLRTKMFIALPQLYYKTICALKRAWMPSHRNVIYYYGMLALENILPLYYARRLGYKIVFDIVEDIGLSVSISRSPYHYFKVCLMALFSERIMSFADGIIVISSHLERKYKALGNGRIPILYRAVSVDMSCFQDKAKMSDSAVSLFYSGSFGKKDGLLVLLDAFDKLAGRYKRVRLILCGAGDAEAMKVFFSRLKLSHYKDRIEYKGYVDDQSYYSILGDVDIPCMTRIDISYAHAGFPFKLGEFLATGKPVIATRVSDVDRFLMNQHNAMLIQAGSSEEICAAAEFLINNPKTAQTIGRRGRETARAYFDYKTQGEALLSFFKSI